MKFSSVVCILAFILGCYGQSDPTQEYPHYAVLNQDETVVLYWEFDDTYITFELHGKTTGWIGMGISPSGGMNGADIIVGWVDSNGKGHITDRHGPDGNAYPPLDDDQNVELLFSQEKEGWTVLKFVRQMAACEVNYDLPITADTLRVIHAYSDTDPTDNDLTAADYHGALKRGTRSILISEVTRTDETEFPHGETHDSFELINDNFPVPTVPSYYNCRFFKLPELAKKQHFVKAEPIITEGNEFNVHHMIFYTCSTKKNNSMHVNTNAECFTSNMPPDFDNCFSVLLAWAIGAGDFYFPMEAGYPIGGENSDQYVVLETHYDNPTLKADIIDSSGMRFIYTPDLRQYDSGFLQVGTAVSGFAHLVPPNAASFLTTGDCVAECLSAGMKQSKISTINVFSAVLHSHLQGRKMKVRHVRDGVELPFIVKDDTYDFNYQENRMLKNEIQIKDGDYLQMVCDYGTVNKNNMTLGGLDTTKEMCMAFMYYYPQIKTVFCETTPDLTQLYEYFGIEEYKLTNGTLLYDFRFSIEDTIITAPENLANQSIYDYLNSLDWTEEKVREFEDAVLNMQQTNICLSGSTVLPGFGSMHPALNVDNPYVEPDLECVKDVHTTLKPVETTSTGAKILGNSFKSFIAAWGLWCILVV